MTPETGSDLKNGPDQSWWVSLEPIGQMNADYDDFSGIQTTRIKVGRQCRQTNNLRKSSS